MTERQKMSLTPEERECLTEAENELLDVMEVAAMEPEFHTERALVGAIGDLARTRLALKQEREDHERTAWAMRREIEREETHFMLPPNPHGNDSDVHRQWNYWALSEVYFNLGSGPAPAWTPEARAAVDKARGEA